MGEPVGPPIVIAHGGMDRSSGFRRTIRHLGTREVLSYDRRGYSGSRDLPVATSMADHVDDLVRICAEFDELPLIVGHSMGGLIALLLLDRPTASTTAAGAVVWEPPLAWNSWYVSRGEGLLGLDPADAAESFMRSVIGSTLWERLPQRMRDERRAEGAALMMDLTGARTPDAVVAFEQITLPVLVGCGTRSAAHHQRSAHEAAAEISSARLVVVEGADHGVHLSDPAAFAALISSWPG